ncbi:9602_t:CDS:1, partial [Cetraspora pellucida]
DPSYKTAESILNNENHGSLRQALLQYDPSPQYEPEAGSSSF